MSNPNTSLDLKEILDDIGFWDENSEIERAHKEQTKQRILEWVEKEVIGEDDELRDKADMLEPTYHRNKGRNELRESQRRRLK